MFGTGTDNSHHITIRTFVLNKNNTEHRKKKRFSSFKYYGNALKAMISQSFHRLTGLVNMQCKIIAQAF